MKYIIFDLDDTLLDDRSQVTDYTLSVLNKLQEMGHKTVINTARSMNYAGEYFEILKPDYAIFNGGAHIVDRQGNTIFRQKISEDVTQQIVDALLAVTQSFAMQTEKILYSHLGSFGGREMQTLDFMKEKFSKPVMKIIARIQEDADAERIARQFDLSYTTYLSGNIRRFNKKGVDKAQGNRDLMKMVGGNLADVLAFGDDLGDMDMLREAGVGVLMKNALPVLHDQGVQLSEWRNDEDGVARFLAKYFELDDYKM